MNFGKTIPQFKNYNSLQPIFSPANRNYGLDQLWPVYAAINQARQFSPALRSSNRYFLNQTGSETPQPNIFSVAKYETANASPNFSDVVFAFATSTATTLSMAIFDVNITQNGSNLFGIQPNRIYNVKNIAAYTAIDPNRRNYWLWNGGTGGIAGSNLLANGVFVSLNPVPTSNAGWSTAPFEAQYLKLYDVTPPPRLRARHRDDEHLRFCQRRDVHLARRERSGGGVSGYHVIVGTTPGGSNVFSGIVAGTSLTSDEQFRRDLYAEVSAINNAGIEGRGQRQQLPAWLW